MIYMNRVRGLCAVVVVFLCTSLGAIAADGFDMRTWTSKKGTEISAKLLKVEGDRVYFQKSNGDKLDVPIAGLSLKDQAVVKKLKTAEKAAEKPAPVIADVVPRPAAGRRIPWNLRALYKTPTIHKTNERPARGMRSFFYEGADYKGKPTWVFAYYSAPDGTPPAGGWPAVVCSHGGGGSAFPDWVRSWNKKGYAAISMDQEGHLPGGNHFGVEGNHPLDQGHQNAGPKRLGWFGDIALPDTEQWFYHAVADVIRANSLLRSFPEINKNKIGLTGISWGGTIVSAVAGVDQRFIFVIPVYGCGFIHKHDMTPTQYQEYMTKWDPSAHLPYAKMPMLWVIGANEPVFPLDMFCKSAEIAGGESTLCIRPFLPHGHGFGWDEVWEIGGFAGGIVTGKTPMPSVARPSVGPDGRVRAKFKGPIGTATVAYTTSDTWRNGILPSVACTVKEGDIISNQPLPSNAKAYMIDARGSKSWGDGSINSVLVKVK